MSELAHILPQQLHAVWPRLAPAVAQVQAQCDEPWLVEDVYCAIKMGGATLLARPALDGFVVLRPVDDPYSGARSLLVWIAWSAPGTSEAVAANTEQIRGIARQAGIGAVVFESPRKGWERRAPALGWRAQSTRWVMEA